MGLDAARGLTVLAAVVLVVAGHAAPPGALGAGDGVGLGALDLVPGALLVLAGVSIGWRRETAGDERHPPRARRRALLLTLAGLTVVAARAGGEVTAAAPDEVLRLAVATGLAAVLLRGPRWLPAVLVAPLLAAPGLLAGGGPLGRGLRAGGGQASWQLEATLGLPTGGVPLASLPAAVALVLLGVGTGAWMARRPEGPASAGALLTVALWSGVGVLLLGQFRAPVPALLDLPVALAAFAAACVLLAAGHLAVHLGAGSSVELLTVAVGRTAIVWTVGGAVALGLAADVPWPELPVAAALTWGGIVAAGVAAGARRLTERVEAVRA